MHFDTLVLCISDDSIYQKYRNIVFDIDISYRIVEKISNFLMYRNIFYISQYFRCAVIFYARSLYFYYCIAKKTRINGENDKLKEANYTKCRNLTTRQSIVIFYVH